MICEKDYGSVNRFNYFAESGKVYHLILEGVSSATTFAEMAAGEYESSVNQFNVSDDNSEVSSTDPITESQSPTIQNLIENGSFEDGLFSLVIHNSHVDLDVFSTKLRGWEISPVKQHLFSWNEEGVAMNWHNSKEFKIKDGDHAVDLIGYECETVATARARLRQTIHTVPDQKYKCYLYTAAPTVGGVCLLPNTRTFIITFGDMHMSVPV